MPTPKKDALHPVIRGLIEDHFEGMMGDKSDRTFFETNATDFYVATVAEAKEQLQRRGVPWDDEIDRLCAAIGFLRTSNAFARHKLGKPWKPGRKLSS